LGKWINDLIDWCCFDSTIDWKLFFVIFFSVLCICAFDWLNYHNFYFTLGGFDTAQAAAR